MELLLSPGLRSKSSIIRGITAGLPSIDGGPVFVSAQPELKAQRGKLVSGALQNGTPVYAASFIRKRRIVLEESLLCEDATFRLILVHEIFHFAWPRLSNEKRREWTALLEAESAGRARGELGESSAVRKGTPQWTEYVCESFCDTGAYLYAGVEQHAWFTLGRRWRQRRKDWFGQRL